MKSQRSRVKGFLVCLFFMSMGHQSLADPRVDRNFLKLPDDRWIWLKKLDDWTTRIIVGKGRPRSERQVLWSKEYEDNDERTWAYAYFVYLKPGKLSVDVDLDGNLEVGIATYDMGNNMIRKILIFSVQKNQLVFVREHGPINLAADESAFK